MLRLMAKQFKPVGSVSVAVPGELKDGPVTEMSVGAISGPLGSVVHGLRIEVALHVGSEGRVTFSMAAADAPATRRIAPRFIGGGVRRG